MGFIQVVISSEPFCTSCVKAIQLFLTNPMKFGLLHLLGTTFTFIGKVFICGASGIIGYFIIENDSDIKSQIHSKLFIVIIFAIIGYIIASLFYMIYGIAADAIILCFFKDKEICEKTGRAPMAPEPMKAFYEKFKK
jgi:hypothetical protein